MTTFEWKILELFADCKGVKYYVKATDGQNFVESEGNGYFAENAINIPFEQIKESNLIEWLPKDDIKLNLETQLNDLKKDNTIEPPWLAGTYIPQV